MAHIFLFAILFTLLLPNAIDANDEEECDFTDLCGDNNIVGDPERALQVLDDPNTKRSDVCRTLKSSSNMSSADARKQYGMGCQELRNYCCMCVLDAPHHHSNTGQDLLTWQGCKLRKCSKGYLYESDKVMEEGFFKYWSQRYVNFRDSRHGPPTCAELWNETLYELSCHMPCEFFKTLQLELWNVCCTPEEKDGIRHKLVIFLVSACIFLAFMVLVYLYVVLSEPRVKSYEEAKLHFMKGPAKMEENNMRSKASASFFLTPHTGPSSISERTLSLSLMAQAGNAIESARQRICLVTFSWLFGCLSCCVLAPLFGVLCGLIFIRDVLGLEFEIAFVWGFLIGAAVSIVIMTCKILREIQIRWYRAWHERRRRDWTCKQRLYHILEWTVIVAFLLIAATCMHGYGPVSCMFCIRFLVDDTMWDVADADDSWDSLRSTCSRFKYESSEYDFHQNAVIIFLVLGPVDMCVRVAVQCGKIWKCESWRYFFSAKLHRGEAITLLAVTTCVVYNLGIAEQIYEPRYCRRLAVTSLLIFLNRAFRIAMYLAGVNLEQMKKDEVDFEKRRVWPHQYQDEKDKYSRRNIVRFENLLDRKSVQFGFFVLQVWFGALYCMSVDHVVALKDEQMGSSVLHTKPLIRVCCSLLCFIMLMELFVRCGAQGFELFFKPATHKFEGFLLVGIMLCFLYAWYFFGSGSWDGFITTLCLILVIIHRITRVIGIHYNVSASGFDAQNVFDAQAKKMFETYCGDIFDVAPQNVHIVVDDDIDIFVTKATLKEGAFDGIHLPIVPEVALVEELHIHVEDQGRLLSGNILDFFQKENDNEPNTLKMKNLMILCGPGDGLASANSSGKRPDGKDYWDPENVKEAKAQLVDMISRRIRAKTDKNSKKTESKLSRKSKKSRTLLTWKYWKQHIKKASKAVKEDIKAGARRDGFRHFTVDIKNVILQFEDGQDQLGLGNALIGARIGSLWIERKRGVMLHTEVFRASIRIEFVDNSMIKMDDSFNNKETSKTLEFTSARKILTWREHRARLDPSAICTTMVKLNASERLRLWASACITEPDATRPLYNHQRLHSRSEDSPERNCIITVLKATISGKPNLEGETPEKADEKQEEHPVLFKSVSQATGQTARQAQKQSYSFLTSTSSARAMAPTMISEEFTPVSAQGTTNTIQSERPWRWHIVTKPLRFKLDDAQLRVVRRITGAVKSWDLRDNSFRWRPDVLPSDASQGTERRTVIWFWWLYAYHGVLASLGRRPNRLGLDLLWRVQLCRRYSSLLTCIAQRCKQGPTLRLDKMEKPGEESELYDLQFKLTLKDILRCRKEVLKTFLQAGQELEIEVTESHTTSSSSMAAITPSSVTSSTSDATTTPVQLDAVSDMFLRSSGHWSIEIPVLELRLCRWDTGRRPVVIHCRSNQVFLDLELESMSRMPRKTGGSWKSKLARLSPHCALAFSVDACSVACPQAISVVSGKSLVPGNRCHIFNVTKPTIFRSPTYPDFTPGRRAGQAVFIGWRTSFVVEEDNDCNPIPIKMEFFAGDMRCIYPVPLVLAFKKFRQSSNPSWDVEAGFNNEFALSPEEHALVKPQNVHQEMVYRQMYEKLRRKKAYTWFKRLVGVQGKSNDFNVDLHMGSIRVQRTRYIRNSMVYVEDWNHQPYCGSFRRGTSADKAKSRLMAFEAFFGDTTSKQCWSQDFLVPHWESLSPEEEQSDGEELISGPKEFLPSSVEWAKRIFFEKNIQQGRLEREYARWRTGVSGHQIFPSGDVGHESMPGNLLKTMFWDLEDNADDAPETWPSRLLSSTSKIWTNKWRLPQCCGSKETEGEQQPAVKVESWHSFGEIRL